MGFRFWRRLKIAPGVTLNLSKSGGSLSFGVRGAKFTIGPRGRRTTIGIPGSGLFYTTTGSGARSKGRTLRAHAAAPVVRPEDRLTMGFFKRLIMPTNEEAFVDGCRELSLGNEKRALDHFRQAVHLADGVYLAGFLSLKMKRFDDARGFLATAARSHDRLGRYFHKYGIAATMSLPVTDEVSAHVGPNRRGVLLGLVEVYQRQGRWSDAVDCLQRLRKIDPEDAVVKLSLVELLLEAQPHDMAVRRRVVRLCEGIDNETPIHAALLLYKAKALRGLGLCDAARDVLTKTLRRKKGRSDELLRALRYERALVYEDLGVCKRSRKELEKLYAEAPGYEDVAARLGIR